MVACVILAGLYSCGKHDVYKGMGKTRWNFWTAFERILWGSSFFEITDRMLKNTNIRFFYLYINICLYICTVKWQRIGHFINFRRLYGNTMFYERRAWTYRLCLESGSTSESVGYHLSVVQERGIECFGNLWTDGLFPIIWRICMQKVFFKSGVKDVTPITVWPTIGWLTWCVVWWRLEVEKPEAIFLFII